MTKKKSYDEVSVVRSLSKKNSIHINTKTKVIEVIKDNNDVGNGSWGKIDYLTKFCGYVVLFVTNINHKPTHKKEMDDEDIKLNNKTMKREAKFNMTAMVKSAMKKVKN